MPRHPGSADLSIKSLCLAGSLCLFALWWAWPRLQSRQSLRAENSQLLHLEPGMLPDFRLEGTQGSLSPASLKGHWTILYFAYSRCLDDCPTTLSALAKLYRTMAAAHQTKILRFVVVSVAADDDAQRIQDFVGAFEPRFEGYAGAWEEREKLFMFFDAGVEVALEQDPDQFQHTNRLFLLDPEAHYVANWSQIPNRPLLHQELCGFINCSP